MTLVRVMGLKLPVIGSRDENPLPPARDTLTPIHSSACCAVAPVASTANQRQSVPQNLNRKFPA